MAVFCKLAKKAFAPFARRAPRWRTFSSPDPMFRPRIRLAPFSFIQIDGSRQADRGFQLLEVRLFGEDTIRLVELLTIEEILHNSRLQ